MSAHRPHSRERTASAAHPVVTKVRWDLGIRRLVPQWRALFAKKHLGRDVVAGVTVAFVAVPLSMAIAIASDAPPAAGLITSVVAGAICALMGGAPLAVSGPAAAMAVLVASVIEEQGFAGLVIASLIAGALQIATGVLGLGRVARLVPLPVVLGFTAGIGVIILVGQLPRALGLPPPDQAHVVDVLTHLGEVISQARPASAVIAFGTLAIVLIGARVSPKVPAHLIAVVVATLVAALFGLDIERVGALPRSLVRVPTLSAPADWSGLLVSAFVIYALASLETLLSCSAVDRLAKSKAHDADQELIGQGLGNVAAITLGGIPATSVIARSSLNVAAGARTRRSALFHAIVVALAIVAAAPLVGQIPIAALAGILLAVAVKMISPHELVALWKISRSEAFIYLVTFVAMVALDLVAGVRVGLVIAFVIAAVRLGRTDARVMSLGDRGPYRFALRGALTFLGLHRIDDLRGRLSELDHDRPIVLDMLGVSAIDVTSADALAALLVEVQSRGHKLAIISDDVAVTHALEPHDPEGHWTGRIVASRSEALRLLGTIDDVTPFERLTDGVDRFRAVARNRYRELFERLATGQSPHTLFIACSDSRVSPLLLTSAEPGEVFVARNVGNIVPRSGADGMPAEGAAVEFAVGVLGVKQIVVCGHSGCGAMGVIHSGTSPAGLPSIAAWLGAARRVEERVPPQATADAIGRANVLVQLENLRTYEIVRKKVESGELQLIGWFYDIAGAEIEQWDAEKSSFVPVRGRKTERADRAPKDVERESPAAE